MLTVIDGQPASMPESCMVPMMLAGDALSADQPAPRGSVAADEAKTHTPGFGTATRTGCYVRLTPPIPMESIGIQSIGVLRMRPARIDHRSPTPQGWFRGRLVDQLAARGRSPRVLCGRYRGR